MIDKKTLRQMETTVADLREGDEVVVTEGTAIVKIAVRKLRSGSLLRLPGDLMITSNHPVRIRGKWCMPG